MHRAIYLILTLAIFVSMALPGKAGEMLTDRINDPHELKNLAADPAHAKQFQK
jgi:hypothetical protein